MDALKKIKLFNPKNSEKMFHIGLEQILSYIEIENEFVEFFSDNEKEKKILENKKELNEFFGYNVVKDFQLKRKSLEKYINEFKDKILNLFEAEIEFEGEENYKEIYDKIANKFFELRDEVLDYFKQREKLYNALNENNNQESTDELLESRYDDEVKNENENDDEELESELEELENELEELENENKELESENEEINELEFKDEIGGNDDENEKEENSETGIDIFEKDNRIADNVKSRKELRASREKIFEGKEKLNEEELKLRYKKQVLLNHFKKYGYIYEEDLVKFDKLQKIGSNRFMLPNLNIRVRKRKFLKEYVLDND